MLVKISQIKVEDRIRKETGDLQSLMDSIQKVGLIHPICVNQNNQLLTGYRRLLACQKLGWEEIEAKSIQLDEKSLDELHFEYHENLGRKNLTYDESENFRQKEENLIKIQSKTGFWDRLKHIWNWIKTIFGKNSSQ